MLKYQCVNCGQITEIGVLISSSKKNPSCQKCNKTMIELSPTNDTVILTNSTDVKASISKFEVGGNFENTETGSFKAFQTDIGIKGNFKNKGEFLINDPEKIKEALLDIAKTAKNASEIGVMVCKRIFGW